MRFCNSDLFLTVANFVVLYDKRLDSVDLLFFLVSCVAKLDVFQKSCLHLGFLLGESLLHVHPVML